MPREPDRRPLIERIDELIEEGVPLQQIADELFISYLQVRSRYLVVCSKMGVKPDGD